MRFKNTLLLTLFLGVAQAQQPEVLHADQYWKLAERDARQSLVSLDTVQGVHLDIRYATPNNFTKQAVYPYPAALVRLPVYHALLQVRNRAAAAGYGLWIWDAYRPYSATVMFWNLIGDERYVANPMGGSRHNRGCAIDLCLYDLKTGTPLPLPTPYDDFSERAHPSYPLPKGPAKEHRELLRQWMEEAGFTVYPSEWWHFDFVGWQEFPLLNVSFEELGIKEPPPPNSR